MIEVFDGAKNVDFNGFKYFNKVEKELPVFTLKEPTVEEWNAKAELNNTKSYIRTNGKQPANYSEVREWVSKLISDTIKAPAATGAPNVTRIA